LGQSGLEWAWFIDGVVLVITLIPMIEVGMRGPLVEPSSCRAGLGELETGS
jgi:hypothetical protein